MRRGVGPFYIRLACLLILSISPVAKGDTPRGDASSTPQWVGVWGAPPAFPNGPSVEMEVIRQTVRLSLGGEALRIRLSNELGSAPLAIASAHVAMPGSTLGSIDPATDHALTFGGQSSVLIQPGMPMVSDPLIVQTDALEDIVVSILVTRPTGPTATHRLGVATTFMSETEDNVAAPILKQATTSSARFFLSGIEVKRSGAHTVVAFGDSITDGYGSTLNQNHRWPDFLSERLKRAGRPIAVVNAGISGNRILHDVPLAAFGPSALARFDRDVLSVPGVRTIILLESINDIGEPGASDLPEQTVSAADIVAAIGQIIARAHSRGIRVIGATLTPFADTDGGYYSAEGETKRQAVNRWIREAQQFDGVVDFDLALRDPKRPDHLAPMFDSGDHLHPNDAGYKKMADSVNLDMLDETTR
jgi:lysophospholipase L1-like esterase